MERTIDFPALQRINPEIVGWLYVPQIGVDSPILTGQTDTEYLTKDFEGAYSPLGSIFTFAGEQGFRTVRCICLPTTWLPDRCSGV